MAKKDKIDSTDSINIFDLDSAEEPKNVGMKSNDPSIHQNIAQFPDEDDDEADKRRSDKRKRLSIFERKKSQEDKEDELIETQMLSKELVETSSRSLKVERFSPTIESGLNDNQIKQRIREGLTNDNQKTYSKTYRQIFLNNIVTFFNVLCLIVAAALVFVKSYSDLTFLFILVINTVIGIVQEIKAKKTIDKLSIVTAPTATVVREGSTKEIQVSDIVLDDIIKLKNGKQISADCEIIDGTIEVNESLLTGEADAIKKSVGDGLYAGSFVTSGTCYAKVIRVGKDCYIQRLQAKAKRYSKPKSELLRSLHLITTFIAIIVVPLGAIMSYRNYNSALDTVQNAKFGSSGSLNIYAAKSNDVSNLDNLSNPISINKYVSEEGKTFQINFNDTNEDLKGVQLSMVDRFLIRYDNKVNGNISISKITIRDMVPTYDPADGKLIDYTATEVLQTFDFCDESTIEDELIEKGYSISRYVDGSYKLGSSGSYIIVKTKQSVNNAYQVEITLQSKAYDPDTEAVEMKNEVLRLTITKTAGSIIGMIPAGMFLLVTVALAVSVVKLSKSKTLVQELYCIEMLARVDCICIDKTGTITDGTMRVKEIIDIAPPKLGEPQIDTILGAMIGALEDNNQTSIALQNKFGVNFEYKKVAAVPFSSVRKMSAVTFEDEGTYIMGAPEFVYQGKSKKIMSIVSKKASMGYRVLMLAKSSQPIVNDKIPSQSTPIALITLEDHIRDEALDTIKWFNENGVAIKVISGDNPATVAEIANKVGIIGASDYISLDGLSPHEVENVASEYTVFGRVSPEQKAIIVKTLKEKKKNTVAMIGDGVNDILAMKEADCSVAMASGSEAARNVSHLVLLDSNFANMPKVVLEGRRVINNIQRAASLYLMKTLFVMILTLLTIFVTNIFTSGYPFTPKQFMLLEMLVIGLPSYVLALQPNKNKISGSFISNIAANCAAQSFCLVLPVIITFFLKTKDIDGLDFSNAEFVSSLCVIAVTYIGFILLINVCRPFNTLRTALVLMVFVLITLVFSVSDISSLFGVSMSLRDIAKTNLSIFLYLLVLVLGIVPIARFFSDFIYRVKNERKKEKEEEESEGLVS